LTRTAEAMRVRFSSETADLDVQRTIRSTIRQAGFPTFRFRSREKNTEYLFVIEQRSPSDHFACWWANVVARLRALGVPVSLYFYDGDLRRCYPENNRNSVGTEHLLDTAEDSTVVVLGDASDLLHTFSGEFYSWVAGSLVKRDKRVIMTPKPTFEWGAPEYKV